MPANPASPVLSRFKVLDLTRVRSGPTCVRQLADWGAEVIKVELPEVLEGGNALGGARNGPDFLNLHRNKRTMTLNLKDPDGLAILKKLAADADVVVENFRPDVKDRLGINYDDLAALNPRIILTSISGFGQDGPYSKRPGFDQIAQGMGGLMSITGLPGQGPVRVGIPIADLTAGLMAAQGTLLALLEREVSGKGQWVQTSLLQAQIFMLDFQAARWLVDSDVPQQAGNNHPTSIPTGVFKTTDGHINIAVAGGKIWERFCHAIGRADFIDNPDYATGPDRSKNRDALNAEIQAELEKESSDHWVDLCNREGIPCGPIYNIDQVFDDPQVKHLGMAKSLYSPNLEKDIDLVAQPINLSRTPSEFVQHPPAYGEQTDELLGELGYSPDEIEDLRARTII